MAPPGGVWARYHLDGGQPDVPFGKCAGCPWLATPPPPPPSPVPSGLCVPLPAGQMGARPKWACLARLDLGDSSLSPAATHTSASGPHADRKCKLSIDAPA